MKILKMNKYGSILTGRSFGKEVVERLKDDKIEFPILLDFSEVTSIASSFADEVFVFIAKNQGDSIFVSNISTKAAEDCIGVVSKDRNFKVIRK